MKVLRIYGVLSLGWCLWEMLYPPWIRSGPWAERYPDTSLHRLGHHWRFTAPMYWSWNPWARTSSLVPDWGARIDYRLMAYEIVLALVAIGFALLLCQALQHPARKLIVCTKVELAILRTRIQKMRRGARARSMQT